MQTHPKLGLIEYFQAIADPRVDRTKEHALIDVLVIAVCWPLLQRIRKKARDSRRARWAREDAEHEARLRNHPEPSDPRKLPGDPD